jgi:hypothetical protein
MQGFRSTLVVLTVGALAASSVARAQSVKTETKVAYLGAPNNIRLSNGNVELILSTDYGPRIMRYAFVNSGDEGNILGTLPGPTAKTEFGEWWIRGGHRLWHAPEGMPRTYEPDNEPIQVEMDGSTVKLIQPLEKNTRLHKEMWITLDPEGSRVTVAHKLTNKGLFAMDVAIWALTVMNREGVAIVPQEPFKPKSDDTLLPVRPMVLWPYTDLTDPRWTLGRSLVLLRQNPALKDPQKMGFLNRQGWAAYARKGALFVKRFAFDATKTYPDYNCNTELFTNDAMLEVETLGPMTYLQPGQSITHIEHWFLFKKEVGTTEAAILAALQPILTETAPR